MNEDPGTSKQDGLCEATPEIGPTPQPSLREQLRQLPHDLARSLMIDRCIATAIGKLRDRGCKKPIFGGL